MLNRKGPVVTGLIVLIVVILVGIFLYQKKFLSGGQQYNNVNTPNSVLQKQDQNFSSAVEYEKQGNYDLALQYLKKALPDANDAVQKAQIEYHIASMTELSGNYASAIAQYKKIAADNSNYKIVRAYAVQQIGLMNFLYHDSAAAIIPNETFKEPPYDSFKKGNDLDLAYRYLFEYAMSIAPLGPSAAQIAYWYSNDLVHTLHGATTTPQGVNEVSIIKRYLRTADAEVERTKSDPYTSQLTLFTLLFEGMSLANLASTGASDFQQAEHYFQLALQYTVVINSRPGNYATTYYAEFIASHYGDKRSADVKKLLSSFRVGNDANIYPRVTDFFRSARVDPTLVEQKKQIALLARIDPDFKVYLESLGWHETDFQKSSGA